ncbi:MAG: hypothetical protein RQ830_03410, partial [Tepidimonas sp.]|nr:hypothetical protein [Tepidimonas sp.]
MPSNKQILLVSRPQGEASVDNFRLVETPTPALSEGQVLVRHHYLSLDPYMRGRMNEGKSYAAPQPLGEVMIGGTVGQVVESRHPRYAPGDWVVGMGGWQEYSVVDADQPGALRKANAAAALAQELAPAKGVHPALDRLVASLPTRVEMMANVVEARRLAQDVALAVQAALLA